MVATGHFPEIDALTINVNILVLLTRVSKTVESRAMALIVASLDSIEILL